MAESDIFYENWDNNKKLSYLNPKNWIKQSNEETLIKYIDASNKINKKMPLVPKYWGVSDNHDPSLS